MTTLALLLIDDFALMSYASVIEPFRAANALAGSTLYDWLHVSVSGAAVTASNGASILADARVGDAIACDVLFVFAAGDPASFDDPATFAWLRKLAKDGAAIAGVSGGPFLIARAGLLDGYRTTIHWEHEAAFRAAFPRLDLENSLFITDRRRMTCAGGTAGLDLAVELIAREHGTDLSCRVSEWFIRTDAREASRSQRQGLRDRFGVSNDTVIRALAEMESRIEEPHSRGAIARAAGVSLRQLERLFAAHMNDTVAATYLRLRLDAAAQLLRSTGMTITALALACGFRSPSHFSRAFKARYGRSPVAARSDEMARRPVAASGSRVPIAEARTPPNSLESRA